MRKHVVDEDVLTLARRRVAQVFDMYDVVAVSFSGGKDSTACLNLALEEARKRKADGRLPADYKLRAHFWDEEAIHPETIAYVNRVRELPDVDLLWLCAPIKHVNASSKSNPYWYPWAPEKRDVWCRDLPPSAVLEGDPRLGAFNREPHAEAVKFLYPASDGVTVGNILGLRADESFRRFKSMAHREKDNWISQEPEAPHIAACKPIYDWTTFDVWTAPKLLGWDWNRAYDVMGQAGIKPNSQRVCHPFGQQALSNLWVWRVCWPDLWERIVMRVPGAATAVRYSRSPLYASRVTTKEDDETWEEAILRALGRWSIDVQRAVSKRIKGEIVRHNRVHPGVPVPDTDPYIDLEKGVSSGVTWAFLHTVAVKGDLKGRMVAWDRVSHDYINDKRAEAWGEDWRITRRDVAARTVWDRSQREMVTPAEAKRRGIK